MKIIINLLIGLIISIPMFPQSGYYIYKGQHIEYVATGIVGQIVGQERRIAHTELIDKVETTDPVTFIYLAMTLQVILTTGKVP